MGSSYSLKPEPFFKGNDQLVVVEQEDFLGLNVGYECSQWRYAAFSDYLFKWLFEFATPFSDLRKLNYANCMEMIKRAAEVVYSTEKYGKRGEFGELMLHAILRELFDTEPIANKLFFKSAVNDPVKGFDAVHARMNPNGHLELWLGEVKFYTDISAAINSVAGEIIDHLRVDKLREEFLCVGNIVDPTWKHAQSVLRLFSRGTSLDDVFKIVCIPVLLTYESKVVKSGKAISKAFLQSLREELILNHGRFREKVPPIPVKIHLVLLPLDSKEELVNTLDKKLRGLQA